MAITLVAKTQLVKALNSIAVTANKRLTVLGSLTNRHLKYMALTFNRNIHPAFS